MSIKPMRVHARRNKDAILLVATQLFLERGSEVQVDDIARAAGLARQTIYNLFGSKAGVLEAVAVYLAGQTAANLLAFEEEAVLEAGLLRLAGSYYDVMLDPRAVQLHRLLTEKSGLDPDVTKTIYRKTAGALKTALTRYLRHHADLAAIDLGDPVLAGEQFLGLVVGPVHVQVTYGFAPDRDRQAQCRSAVDTFLRAFAAAPKA